MLVAGLQLDIAWEDPAAPPPAVLALAARAAPAGARLLVLPEMFVTGFSMDAALTAAHGPASLELLVELARTHRCWVVGGFVEAAAPRPYNVCAVLAPDGREVARYRKIHPFSLAGEHHAYGAGDRLVTVDVDGLAVTPLICYDLRFPELFRSAAARTELFVVVANWPTVRGHAWRTLCAARAMDSQAYLLAVNRVGAGQGHDHRGDSTLVDPLGEPLASAAVAPAVILGEVDPLRVASVRRHFSFLTDRRPELYPRLAE